MAQEKIDSLTKEQEAMMPVYVKKYIEIGLDTSPFTEEECRTIVNGLYENVGLTPPPRIEIVESPKAALNKYQEVTKCTKDELKNQVFNFCYGSQEASWISFYKFMKEVVGIKNLDKLDKYSEILKLGWCLFYDEMAIVCKKPLFIKMENNLLHCATGPAIAYGDGTKFYYYKGIDMGDHTFAIDTPEKITVDHITKEQNQEVKRVLLEIFGYERYITESGAQLLHEDTFRNSPVKFYRIKLNKNSRNEEITVDGVLVINSTAEPDGTFKKYFIKVEPNKYKRAVEALASTFRRRSGEVLTEEEYRLVAIET